MLLLLLLLPHPALVASAPALVTSAPTLAPHRRPTTGTDEVPAQEPPCLLARKLCQSNQDSPGSLVRVLKRAKLQSSATRSTHDSALSPAG